MTRVFRICEPLSAVRGDEPHEGDSSTRAKTEMHFLVMVSVGKVCDFYPTRKRKTVTAQVLAACVRELGKPACWQSQPAEMLVAAVRRNPATPLRQTWK